MRLARALSLCLMLAGGVFAAGPAISAYTLTAVSQSELLGTWTTDATSTSALTCGTSPGTYTITSETVNPLSRGYSVTAHRMTIAGLQPSTLYYCKPISVSAGGSTTGGTELSATTTARITQRSFGAAIALPAIRYNDQYPINGRRSDGDASFCGWAGDGNTYCGHQDGAIINTSTAFDTYIWKWPTSSDTTLTNGVSVSAWTNAGTVRDAQNQTYNDGGGAWATNGVFAVWDEASQTSIVYHSIYRRILNATLADASIVKSPDFGVHWIAPQNNTGPGVTGTLQGDMPSSSGNAMWPGSTTAIAVFATNTCQDHRDCANTYANERSYQYFSSGLGNGSNRCLFRMRLENLTLQDATLIESYHGAQSGDDGTYAANWSTTHSTCTVVGSGLVSIYNTITYLPDFHTYMGVAWERTSSVDVTPKSIMIQQMDYPWSVPVVVARITPPGSPSGYLPAFAQPLLATYTKTGNSPLTASIKIHVSGYITGANFSDPTIDQYSLFNYSVTLTNSGASSVSGAVKFAGGVTIQ